MLSVCRAEHQYAAKVTAGTSTFLLESDTKEVRLDSQVVEINTNSHFSLQQDISEQDNFDLALCEAIKRHPNIYNHGFNRKKIEASDEDWIMISDEVNKSVAECKVRYNKLREWYVRQKNRKLNGSRKCKKPNHFDSLTFLDPYIFPRNRKKNSKKNSQNVSTHISELSAFQDESKNICPDSKIEVLNHSVASRVSFEEFDNGYEAHENDGTAERVFVDVDNLLPMIPNQINSDKQTKDMPSRKVDESSSKNKSIAENIALTNLVVTRLKNIDDLQDRNTLILGIMDIIFSSH